MLDLSIDRKSTRLNSSHLVISYAVFCLKKKQEGIDHSESGLAADRRCALRSSRPGFSTRAGAARQPDDLWLSLRRVGFFFNDTATPEIYPLSLHDALPI